MSAYLHPPRAAVVDAVQRALAEDLLPLGDLTAAILPDGVRTRATVAARQAGVLAGQACVSETYAQLDASGPDTTPSTSPSLKGVPSPTIQSTTTPASSWA